MINVFALCCCLGMLMQCAPRVAAQSAVTTVYVVRHAEKLDPADGDSPISPVGEERAQALSVYLARAGVERIYATTLRRTQQTVAPLAARIDATPVVLDPFATEDLVRSIRTEDTGKVVLVAGHSNTIPGIIKALSGLEIDGIPEERFDRLYKVVLPPDGKNTVEELRFGVETP